MPPGTEADRRLAGQVLALVNAQAAARDQVSASVRAQVARAVAGIADWYDPRQVDAFVDAATEAVRSGRLVISGLTEAYLRQQLDLFGVAAAKVSPMPSDQPRNIPVTEQWARPVKQYRYARLRGLDDLEAGDRAAARADLMADTDLTLAMRDTAGDLIGPLDRVRGWRRLVHPEVSTGGSCGLCVVAADRLYGRRELLPIHDRCRCTVGVVVDGRADAAGWLNRDALNQLYADSGGTAAAKLKRTRYSINDHGELGPVLTDAGDNFRGPGDVADDTDRPAGVEPIDLAPADVPDPEVADHRDDLGALADDELALLVADPDVAADPERLDAVLAELDRRDAEDRRQAEFDTASGQADDDFAAAALARFADRDAEVDEEAEAAGLNPAEVQPPRRLGGTPAQEVREEWDRYVAEQMLAAEDATRGNLLSRSGKGAGGTVYDLFTGDSVRAVRWASEELLAWWQEDERRRMSWPEWRAAATGASSPAARKSRERFSKTLQRWEDTRRGRGRGR